MKSPEFDDNQVGTLLVHEILVPLFEQVTGGCTVPRDLFNEPTRQHFNTMVEVGNTLSRELKEKVSRDITSRDKEKMIALGVLNALHAFFTDDWNAFYRMSGNIAVMSHLMKTEVVKPDLTEQDGAELSSQVDAWAKNLFSKN